ncbi:hypothetical protein NXH67_00710 [Butyrivibrio sp. DSM 10294]|uniref:hypothetical protein n=1 Tax=Butyrivibrio sp. DSM 10294 TaxID=2972457 RepID=UPI00234E45BC|nr:hypothetical protein [Butyrivibrio sp. DSM 10294]MDC7292040.1 hypothetical protein [Butyrivibrio sp. DSM 10294]
MKHHMRIKLMVVTVLIATIFLSACAEGATFSGSKTGDKDHFDIDFEVLNTSYSHELEMKEGEALDVMVEAESGTISLLIQKGDDKPAYRGTIDESTEFQFQVGIETEGTYTLTVSGDKAKGHVIISRAHNNSN